MRSLLLAAAAALSVALASPVMAAAPRTVVAHVADQIAANYFDPAKGAEVAAALKAEAAKGAYDAYEQPLDLARALTDRLKPLDAHFQVTWAAPAAAPPPSATLRAAVVDDADVERRSNYGFRAAEVLPGNIGRIDLRHFAHFRGPDDPARVTADAAMTLVAGTDAVIVDLRDNGGGSPAMVGYLASYFVPPGADIYNTFKGRGPDQSEKPPLEVRGARRLDVPLYILTSARTGSAAESFAYTLQAAKRATIVGEASAGAANPGGFAPAGDGFSVFVSGGRPVNPITRTNWEGVGVVPDVAVPAGEAPGRAQALALTRVLASGPKEPAATESRWALEQLAPAAAIAPQVLAGYAGTYGSRRIAVEGGRAFLHSGRRPPLPLKALSPDTFAVEDGGAPLRVKFERDTAGRVIAFVLMGGNGAAFRYVRS